MMTMMTILFVYLALIIQRQKKIIDTIAALTRVVGTVSPIEVKI